MATQPPLSPVLEPMPLRSENRSNYSALWELFGASLVPFRAWMVELATWMHGTAQSAANEAVANTLNQLDIWEDGSIKINNSVMTKDITMPADFNGSITGPIKTNGFRLKVPAGTRLKVL